MKKCRQDGGGLERATLPFDLLLAAWALSLLAQEQLTAKAFLLALAALLRLGLRVSGKPEPSMKNPLFLANLAVLAAVFLAL